MDLARQINTRLEAHRRRRGSCRIPRGQVRAAVEGKTARLRWDLSGGDQETEDGIPIGERHPGQAAVAVVREALSQFDLPHDLKLRYAGMTRTSGYGPARIHEGHVTIAAEVRTVEGATTWFDVPVVVRAGRILRPAVLIHEQRPRVLAQTTLDDILNRNDFDPPKPDRMTMFSPPGDRSLSKIPPGKARRARAVLASTPDHLDVAEQAPAIVPGSEVKLTADCLIGGRGGATVALPKGAKGVVIRDRAGDGREYIVEFADVLLEAVVPRELIDV